MVNLRLHLFDQTEHIAHVQNPAGGPIRMEHIQTLGFFTDTDEFDRLAGNVANRQGGTTAGVAVGFGQDHAGQRQCLAECFGGVGRILTGHGIDHEQGFHRIQSGMQLLDFGHHGGIDGQTAGGIDQHHVHVGFAGFADAGFGDVHRRLAGLTREEIHPHLFGQGFQLGNRGRAIDVAADHHHFLLALFLQEFGQFADRGGFTGTLQTRHQDDGRRRHIEVQIDHLGTHHRREFIVDDFNQGLAGSQAGEYFLADRARLDALDQGHYHRQGDIGLEQGDAHFTQGVLYVVFGQPADAAQAL